MAEALSLHRVEDVIKCVASIHFVNGAVVAIYFTVEAGPGSTVRIEATSRVRNVLTGEPMDTSTYELLPLPTCPRMVYLRCHRMYDRSARHEVNESFSVEGHRPFDPHKPKRW